MVMVMRMMVVLTRQAAAGAAARSAPQRDIVEWDLETMQRLCRVRVCMRYDYSESMDLCAW